MQFDFFLLHLNLYIAIRRQSNCTNWLLLRLPVTVVAHSPLMTPFQLPHAETALSGNMRGFGI